MIEASGEGEDEEVKTECPAHQTPPPKKGVMTDKEVYANCIGLLDAGNDTTSITLSFASYLLAVHPDIQQRLQSEIDAYFDEKPVSSDLSINAHVTNVILFAVQDSNLYSAAQEITYLDQVVQETLRVYPPAIE